MSDAFAAQLPPGFFVSPGVPLNDLNTCRTLNINKWTRTSIRIRISTTHGNGSSFGWNEPPQRRTWHGLDPANMRGRPASSGLVSGEVPPYGMRRQMQNSNRTYLPLA